ncbi:serine hydrolase domain-containing protein [Priestia megaterium]|uniref:serine hydrolase domain-containing protein n=1 Tax=Priestia megaterium TaxID=1404 RepID=UPI00064CC7D1|nr:serine hydrolase domain-containing protein [Priestia megaterium]KLV29411.1 penicillin-binding protein [Priestia megaterium]
MNSTLTEKISDIHKTNNFSGSIYVQQEKEVLANVSYGFANRSEKIKNQSNTRYSIASGSKFFTSIAICQLVQAGKLSLHSRVKDCLNIDIPHLDPTITVYHLLTHASGISDYFDEEIMTNYEELWIKRPMYKVRELEDFLPLFKEKPMKHSVGSKFHYNNAGYILLGLIIEQASRQTFSNYVEEHIFKRASMDAGYFEMDSLPGKVALGYIEDLNNTWKTNIYSIPAKGGADGGAYVTAKDMVQLWESLMRYELLNEEMTKYLLTPQIQVDDTTYYGYGIWIKREKEKALKYVLMGYDPGVNFRSLFYPNNDLKIVVCSNKSEGAFDMISSIEKELTKKMK